MKSNKASITFAVTLVLGTCQLALATPLFNIPSANHLNDASIEDICQDFRITYPAKEGVVFDDNSKHIVAWQAADSIKQVNLTLVSNQNPSSTAYIGTYDATLGATDEVLFSLQGRQDGDYHVHIAGQGDNSQFCEADSATFKINALPANATVIPSTNSTVTNAPTSSGDTQPTSTSSTDSTGTTTIDLSATTTTPAATTSAPSDTSSSTAANSSIDQTQLDNLLEQIHKSTASSNPSHEDDTNWTSALDEVSDLTKGDKPHSNDPAIDDILEQIHSNRIHNNAVNTEQESSDPSFRQYIDSLDQDYKKYIHKNKETETEAVTHKNDADPYFTNEDLSTHENAADYKQWHSNDANPYFTNTDLRTNHNNGEWEEEEEENHVNYKQWHSDDANPYFTNTDLRTNHNNGEWEEVNDEHDNEATPSNGWSSTDPYQEPPSHDNLAEWEEEGNEHTNEWQSDDPIVHSPSHDNYAEWVEEDNTHNNSWESTDPYVEPSSHDNDAEWIEENDGHTNGWQSEDAYVESSSHDNDAEWVEEDNNHNNGWESEDLHYIFQSLSSSMSVEDYENIKCKYARALCALFSLNVVSRKDTIRYKFFIGNNEKYLDTFEPRDCPKKVRATESNGYLKERNDLLSKRSSKDESQVFLQRNNLQ
ncbi:hypothetical protein BCV71DRAFT_258659 [Rhizopus microsporus]|uniref:GOLD domain-containing protein n=1 Tax=Rhizopus microsporus TaxID=58291 RepID=A0A1X0RMN6_RHIZD|nr:hypothetical protein BCV71DRAFT_258659 [Rhizopus microsporus]